MSSVDSSFDISSDLDDNCNQEETNIFGEKGGSSSESETLEGLEIKEKSHLSQRTETRKKKVKVSLNKLRLLAVEETKDKINFFF